MEDEQRAARSVLVFSSGNPDATYLAAGLLRERPGDVGTVLLRGVGDGAPAQEVGRVLADAGLDPRGWVPQADSAPPAEPVDVGLIICVPTCDT